MATYTQAQIAQIGKLFESASGGLVPAPVASAWASAEQGRNNNVFGLGASTAGVPGFASVNAAVLATWSTISNSGTYAQTLARLKAAGGNVRGAALAIAESPWRLGPSGVKAAGGVDPYYGKVFQQAGLLTSADISGGRTSGGGTWKPAAGGASSAGGSPTGGTTSTVTQDTLKALGIDSSAGHVFTDADIWKITMKATGQDPNAPVNPNNQIYQAYLANLRGKTVAQMVADAKAGVTYQAPDPITAVANAIGSIPGQIIGFVIPIVVLVGLLWLGKQGVEKTLG